MTEESQSTDPDRSRVLAQQAEREPGSFDEQAEELFERLGDDPAAKDALVELYYPLVKSLARRYQGYGEPLDDLIQVASIALLKAVDRFDLARGVRFSSYAAPTIVGELKRHFRDRAWSVRVPRRLQENALLLRDVVEELSQMLQRSPTVDEICERSGLDEESVLEAMDVLNAYTGASIDAPGDEDHDMEHLSILATEDERIELIEGWADLAPQLERLADRERQILYLRFFRGWTQSRIARELGISQMHVSRLLNQTLAALRVALAEVD
jgi:RNA polymerase sigma-B factor